MIMKLPLLLLLIFSLVACDADLVEQEVFLSDLLVNCWNHSHEEDKTSDINIFRPCDDRDFPISRFRKSIDIRPDGTVTYLVLSPIDAHYTEEGIWSYDALSQILEIKDPQGKIHLSKKVIMLDESILELKEVP